MPNIYKRKDSSVGAHRTAHTYKSYCISSVLQSSVIPITFGLPQRVP